MVAEMRTVIVKPASSRERINHPAGDESELDGDPLTRRRKTDKQVTKGGGRKPI